MVKGEEEEEQEEEGEEEEEHTPVGHGVGEQHQVSQPGDGDG